MSEHRSSKTSDDPREQYEHGRDAFGAKLFAAARSQEAPSKGSRSRRQLATGGIVALAGGLAAFAIGIPSPLHAPHDDPAAPGASPLVGPSSALAAVTAMRSSLHTGVLEREVVNQRVGVANERSRFRDWTDLATRDQHMQFLEGPGGASEYWNPSLHDRVQLEPPEFSSPDGRRVVSVSSSDNENASASESPVEEIDRLLKEVRAGKLTSRRSERRGEIVFERREKCFSQGSAGYLECGELDPKRGTWPTDPPKRMTAVLSYERWWVADGRTPRMLRYDNGTLAPNGTGRRPIFRSEYLRWNVMPRSEANLDLVRVPDFDDARFFVIRGGNSVVSDALRRGTIVCKSDRRGFCDER